jgi:hypothetical protein
VAPDLIVFHCTDTSMTQGPHGEGRILEIIKEATGIEALATSRLVLEALQALGLRRLLLLSPYKSNQAVIDYHVHVTADRPICLNFSAPVQGRVRDVSAGLGQRCTGRAGRAHGRPPLGRRRGTYEGPRR